MISCSTSSSNCLLTISSVYWIHWHNALHCIEKVWLMLIAICLHFKGALWLNKPRSLEFWAVFPGYVSYSSKSHGCRSPSNLEPRDVATFYEEWRCCYSCRRRREGKVLFFSQEENLTAVYIEFCFSIFFQVKYICWIKSAIMWFEFVYGSGLSPRVFLWVLWFSSLHKDQDLEVSILLG